MFTSGGNQGKVIWLDGEPVTIAGRDRFVAVFYHESSPLMDGTQKLGYMIYDAVADRTVSKGTVSCVATGGSLAWAGFDNQGSLMALDSSGMLSMLICTPAAENETYTNWEWVPMLDTVGLRKSPDDSHWPITAADGKLVCILLKGGRKHPEATPRRPVQTTLGFRMPLARGVLVQA